MAIRLTTKLERIRPNLPQYINQVTYPIYLGMPPLPIGMLLPLKGGATNVASISGIGIGSVKSNAKSPRTKGLVSGVEGTNFGTSGVSSKRKKRSYTASGSNTETVLRPKTRKKRSPSKLSRNKTSGGRHKRSRVVSGVLTRGSNGRFKRR